MTPYPWLLTHHPWIYNTGVIVGFMQSNSQRDQHPPHDIAIATSSKWVVSQHMSMTSPSPLHDSIHDSVRDLVRDSLRDCTSTTSSSLLRQHLKPSVLSATVFSGPVMSASQCNILHATHCNKLQQTATHCNTLHTATHCNTLQHTATHCNTLQDGLTREHWTHCNALFHYTAAHCNTLLWHTATHCNTMQDELTQLAVWRCNTLQHSATLLQHTAPHCTTL